jgi:hypothetical protein
MILQMVQQNPRFLIVVAIFSVIIAPLVPIARGQDELPSYIAETPLNSGEVQNRGTAPLVVFSGVVRVPNAPWVRLTFDTAILSGNQSLGNGSYLQITSLQDGAFQILDATSIAQWQNTTAYFNGEAVRVELIAHPQTGTSEVSIQHTIAGDFAGELRTICGLTDDRVLSNDVRVARILPIGCTGWLINDEFHCFLSAGHCGGGGLQTVQFNVPLSNENGMLISPPPEDQYAVDSASQQYVNGGAGNDWAYFGCFPNSNTGLTPYQAMGSFFVVANPPPVSDQTLRVTGFGTTQFPISPTWNQVQKTDAGSYASLSGTAVRYYADTTGGNSGSPIIDESTGLAIGIHTHGGCTPDSGTNLGTGMNNAGLQYALNHPTGICENDPTPPEPNPMSFSVTPTPIDSSSITMQAIEAIDPISAPVQYYFDFVGGSDGGSDSGWQESRDYVDTALLPNSFYNYVVRARDSNIPTPNMTGNSPTITVATPIESPIGISFGAISDTSIKVHADGSFTNVGLASTGFYFELTPAVGLGGNSWVGGPNTIITDLTPCTQYTIRTKARNYEGTETDFVGPVITYTTGCTGCLLVGDLNGNGYVEGGDIPGFVRTKLGSPAGNDYSQCADYGTGTLDGDLELFLSDLLAKK